MVKRASAWFLVAAGLWACGGGDGAASVEEPSSPASPSAGEASSSDGVAATERDVAPVARYRFVDTSEGMTVEATTEARVTTFSCPTRTCRGMCDECAVQACRATGELSEACEFLATSCNDTCSCDIGESCGFPVCAFDPMICYVGNDAAPFGSNPPGDPSPFGPAGRPGESSSNASRPSF